MPRIGIAVVSDGHRRKVACDDYKTRGVAMAMGIVYVLSCSGTAANMAWIEHVLVGLLRGQMASSLPDGVRLSMCGMAGNQDKNLIMRALSDLGRDPDLEAEAPFHFVVRVTPTEDIMETAPLILIGLVNEARLRTRKSTFTVVYDFATSGDPTSTQQRISFALGNISDAVKKSPLFALRNMFYLWNGSEVQRITEVKRIHNPVATFPVKHFTRNNMSYLLAPAGGDIDLWPKDITHRERREVRERLKSRADELCSFSKTEWQLRSLGHALTAHLASIDSVDSKFGTSSLLALTFLMAALENPFKPLQDWLRRHGVTASSDNETKDKAVWHIPQYDANILSGLRASNS